jgi:hypothetical protein
VHCAVQVIEAGARRAEALDRAEQLAAMVRQAADVAVVRGILALEAGQNDQAREYFESAMQIWGGEAQAKQSAGLDFGGRPVAQRALELLDIAGKNRHD